MNLHWRIALVTCIAAGLVAPCTAQTDQTWELGIIAPTTGPIATVGQRQLETARWWEQAVNSRGGIGGRMIHLQQCNDEGNPEKAVSCMRELLAHKVILVFNSSVTGPIRATMPLVSAGPVMLTPSPNVMPPADSYVFQVSPSDLSLTQSVAAYLKRNKLAQLGMISATDASGEVGVASAKAVFPAAGIQYSLARIDLRANDASIQLASVAKSDVNLIYSTYSGAGAATVVKSFVNLGLSQPLVVSYANVSDAFVTLIRNDMPPRLLATGVRATVPELLADPAEREHTLAFARAFEQWKHERIDQINLNALAMVDIAESVLRNVPDPRDARAVRAHIEKTPVLSFQRLHFSATSHIGLGPEDCAVIEYRDGRWVEAGPVR